jgi:hypothetical protein
MGNRVFLKADIIGCPDGPGATDIGEEPSMASRTLEEKWSEDLSFAVRQFSLEIFAAERAQSRVFKAISA